jgi:hypothetical protein
MSASTDPAMLNYVIRMVVPMKREFGESLDVQQFMRDASYSKKILAQARTSQDQRLRDYAEYVSRHMLSARDTSASGAAAASAAKAATPAAAKSLHSPGPDAASAAAASPAPRSAPAAAPAVGGEPTAEELRARMLRKYTSGLR